MSASRPAVVATHRWCDTRDNAITNTREPLWACARRHLRGDEKWVITKRGECEFFDCKGPHYALVIGPEITTVKQPSGDAT